MRGGPSPPCGKLSTSSPPPPGLNRKGPYWIPSQGRLRGEKGQAGSLGAPPPFPALSRGFSGDGAGSARPNFWIPNVCPPNLTRGQMAQAAPLVRNGSIRRQKVAGEPVAGSSLDVGHSPERFLSRPFEPPSVSTQLCRFATLMRASTSNAALLPPPASFPPLPPQQPSPPLPPRASRAPNICYQT